MRLRGCVFKFRDSPFVLGQRSSSFLKGTSFSGDLGLLIPSPELDPGLVAFCFGLYEQRPAWSLFTQFSHGSLLSHFTCGLSAPSCVVFHESVPYLSLPTWPACRP